MKQNTYPFITQRLWEVHQSPEAVEGVCEMLRRHPGACDEVWFSSCYGFPTLDDHKAAAEKMAAAAGRIRELGIAASLQISNTLGHGEYVSYLSFEGLTWQRMVGHDGQETPCSNCPRDPAFLAYLAASTEAYCAWKPASLWIDDDLRMHYHGRVSYGCFCPRCLAAFNAQTGAAWTRETLVAALNDGDGGAVRRAWIAFGRESLGGIARTVATAARAVSPETRLGFQHPDLIWGSYNGPDYAPIFEALSAVSGRPVGSRPGGGFYDDHAPRGAFYKALLSGQQNSRLPACVDDVRIEIENFPASVSGKSVHGTAVEGTLALAYGSNALTLTPLMFLHEEAEWHERLLSTLADWRPFWLRYLEASAGSRPSGLTIALGKSFVYRKTEGDFAWTNSNTYDVVPLATLGVPLTWDYGDERAHTQVQERAHTQVRPYLLHPNAADGLTDDEIRALMARNVITDGETLLRLQRRNLASDIPVTAEAIAFRMKQERFTDDPLNGHYAGQYMGILTINPAIAATALHPRNGDARILAHFEDAAHAKVAPATV
ncbi:MAG: hypothetical protein FWF84_04945, partial [Kiritimatiellaeota bacterium]|nr:hypothetical protein [Kiritimatiellota bacterium]